MTQEQAASPLFSANDLKKLILPLIAEQFLAVTVGMADTVMVSSVGEAAVSGISIVDQINTLLIQVFAALATGGAVVASQYLGRRERNHAVESAKQLYYVTLLLSLLIGVVCVVTNRGLLSFIYGRVEPDVMENAATYFWLSALSYPFIALYNAGAALFRSMGNSKVSLYASLGMNVINIGGNALLIYGLHWGVAGAAAASLLSRLAAAVMVTVLLFNPGHPIYLHELHKPTFHPGMVKSILRIGIPTGLENGMFQVGKLLVAGMITTYGTAAIAANAVCNNVTSMNNIPASAIGLAAVTVVGRCVGARDTVQARRYGVRLMGLAHLSMVVVSLLVFFSSPALVGFYEMSSETTSLALGIIRIVCLSSIAFWPCSFTLPQILRAAGDAKYTMAVSMFSMWVFRVGFSVVLGTWLNWGLLGVWAAMIIDWVVRDVFFVLRFLGNQWLQKKVIE